MAKLMMRILSSACVIAFVFYLHKLDIFFDKRFAALLILFLAFGSVSLIQGVLLEVDNDG
jgi:hypothetical protein